MRKRQYPLVFYFFDLRCQRLAELEEAFPPADKRLNEQMRLEMLVDGGGESSAHLALKLKTIRWLEAKHILWIAETIIPPRTPERVWALNQRLRPDIIGFTLKGAVIPIECGSLSNRKAVQLVNSYPASMHWPYGAEHPHCISSCKERHPVGRIFPKHRERRRSHETSISERRPSIE